MKAVAPRLLTVTALFVATVGFGSADSAESPRHFEGPYHVTIEPLERVRATVTSTFRFSDLDAHEWWAAFPSPPEFQGQPSAAVQVRIAEAPFAEVDQITDDERHAAAHGRPALVSRRRRRYAWPHSRGNLRRLDHAPDPRTGRGKYARSKARPGRAVRVSRGHDPF